MMAEYIKYKPTGVVFPIGTNPAWVDNPDFELVADCYGTALPPDEPVIVEANDPQSVEERKGRAKRVRVKADKIAKGETVAQAEAEVSAETDAEIDIDLASIDAALAADASRGLP